MTEAIRSRNILAALFTLLLVAACGSSGGGDPVSDTPPAPPPIANTGTVGIIITDLPSDDFSEIRATISSIELLGGSGNATIFTGNETIDLLQLDSVTELFTVEDGVPAGDYNKIRLRLSDLTLVRIDDAGNVETVSVDLPGNGKIDLNPRQTFFVSPGSTLLLELDIDAKKSIKITDNNQTYRFRPVIFVKIHDGVGNGRLARVHGTVDSIGPDANELVLCQTDFVADSNHEDSDGRGDNRCLTVNTTDDTGIFGADGEPADISTVMVGDALTVIGNLRVSDEKTSSDDSDTDADSDSDADFDDDDLILEALVIEIGELGTFERLRGTIASEPNGALEFALDIAPGQGFGDDSSVTARLQMGTRIFDRAGAPLDESALTTGTDGHFEGVLMLSDTDPDILKTALIVLDTDADSGETLSGEIQTIDLGARNMTISTDLGDRCVVVPEDTKITLVTVTDDGMTSDMVELADLMAGMTVDIFGHDDGAGCFLAQTIRAENDVSTGGNRTPIAEAGPNQDVTTGDTVTLDGAGSSDPDGDALTFNWMLSTPTGSAAALSDDTAESPTFVADLDGEYVAKLVVNDGTADSDPDMVTIVASTGSVDNVAPVADAGPDQAVTTGDTVVLDGTNSVDADGDALTAAWTLIAADGSAATLDDPSSFAPSFVADVAGEYSVQLVVNDGTVDSDPDTVIVVATSLPVNQEPTADAGPNQDVSTGDTVTLDGSLSADPDGDSLTYNWSLTPPTGSAAALSDSASMTPMFVADVDGEYLARLVVNDGTDDSAPDSVVVTATTTIVLDGEALYSTHCSGCHEALANTEVGSSTAADIQAAIDSNRGGMGFLSTLTSEEVTAIAAALEGR